MVYQRLEEGFLASAERFRLKNLQEFRRRGIYAKVMPRTKRTLREIAKGRGTTISGLVGKLLDEYVEGVLSE